MKRNKTILITKKLSYRERLILERIVGIYSYMARNRDGSLFLYSDKPSKDKDILCRWFVTKGLVFKTWYSELFQMVQWSDLEPTKISALLGEER